MIYKAILSTQEENYATTILDTTEKNVDFDSTLMIKTEETSTSFLILNVFLFNMFRNSISTAQKMRFGIKVFFIKCVQIRKFSADLDTFTEVSLNAKLHFLCSAFISIISSVLWESTEMKGKH